MAVRSAGLLLVCAAAAAHALSFGLPATSRGTTRHAQVVSLVAQEPKAKGPRAKAKGPRPARPTAEMLEQYATSKRPLGRKQL